MYDIIIIGSGVAGMTAALYSLRANKKVLIIDKEGFGGQVNKSPKIENYPTKKSVSGSVIADELFDQITDLGVVFELEKVEAVAKKDDYFVVKTDYGFHKGKSIIIANGVTPRKLNVSGEDQFLGKGVYPCAICDGPFFAGQEVCLVGDANSALQYALMLSSYCTKVKMFTMFDKFFGEQCLIEAVKNTSNIEVTPNAVVCNLKGGEHLQEVEFKKTSGEKFSVKTNALFVAIGFVPDNERFKNIVDLDALGYINAGEDCTTKTEGVFVCGDTRVKKVRQVATAIGDGAVAATAAINYLSVRK